MGNFQCWSLGVQSLVGGTNSARNRGRWGGRYSYHNIVSPYNDWQVDQRGALHTGPLFRFLSSSDRRLTPKLVPAFVCLGHLAWSLVINILFSSHTHIIYDLVSKGAPEKRTEVLENKVDRMWVSNAFFEWTHVKSSTSEGRRQRCSSFLRNLTFSVICDKMLNITHYNKPTSLCC